MAYRLLALDLDGTTCVDGGPPAPAVQQSVRAAVELGVHVVIATGRPYLSAVRFAQVFNATDPVICYQGALVKEQVGERRTLLAEAMPRAPLEELLCLADERRWELFLYSERAIYVASPQRPQSYYDSWFGLELEPASSLMEGLRMLDGHGHAPLKTLTVAEPADCDRMVPDLRKRFDGRLSIERSHRMFVEATAPVTNKGRALAILAEHLGVAREETIAVGDSGNDISMLRWAGLGVAMGNASPDVQAVADWVAPPISEDGVAAVVERWLLDNRRSQPSAQQPSRQSTKPTNQQTTQPTNEQTNKPTTHQ